MGSRPAVLAAALLAVVSEASAGWGSAPAGWEDFRFALADDNTRADTIARAQQAGTKVYGRYRYLNAGVDTNTNWYGYSGPGGATLNNFDNNSRRLGIASSYVVYMLQEEGMYAGFRSNVTNANFMRAYFWNLVWTAKAVSGKQAVLVIEPDTWGYLLQYEREQRNIASPADYGKGVAAEAARVNDLGYPHLAGLPNTVAGLCQGIVKTFRTHAPDARIGFHFNTWAWYPKTGGDVRGLVYWPDSIVAASAAVNAAFMKNLFGGGGTDRGDFAVVEKNGLDAGFWQSRDNSELGRRYFWTDAHMAKWLRWTRAVGELMDLPLLGWQIAIGHMGLPNVENRWQDTFMEYFFAHPRDFAAAGFIGLWVGEGLPPGTDYSNGKGRGDDGFLFSKLREFEGGRPYLASTAIRPATQGEAGNVRAAVFPRFESVLLFAPPPSAGVPRPGAAVDASGRLRPRRLQAAPAVR